MRLRKKPTSALEAALRRRPYIHFDQPLRAGSLVRLITCPEKVTRHSFHPFLQLDIVRNRVKRMPDGTKKWSKKVREIRYASHIDAAIYAFYNHILSELYERRLEKDGLANEVTAFRSLGMSNVDFATEAFRWIAGSTPCVAIGLDVRDFFGSLDHQLLKGEWAKLLDLETLPPDHYAVFRSLTKHASVNLIQARQALGLTRSSMEKLSRLCCLAPRSLDPMEC